MNVLQELILTSDFVAGPTPPTNFKSEPWEAWLNGFLILTIVLIIFIIFLCCLIYDKNKTIKSLKNKAIPYLYTDNATKDIIIISNDDYSVISIKFLIYDENNNFVKEYIVQEYDLSNGEQRIIANTSEFSEYKIKCKIINYKEKV